MDGMLHSAGVSSPSSKVHDTTETEDGCRGDAAHNAQGGREERGRD